MPLKYKFKTKDEIPAEHQALYAEREGAWVFDVDGAIEKTKLDELRNTNVALLKECDDFKKRYEGIDPDAVKALADEKRQLEEAQQFKAGEFEKLVEHRIKGVKADLEKQITLLARLAIPKGRQDVFALEAEGAGSMGARFPPKDNAVTGSTKMVSCTSGTSRRGMRWPWRKLTGKRRAGRLESDSHHFDNGAAI